MDYEEKYKAALERAKKLASDLPNGRNDRIYHIWDLESIFPELAENKDERIRKELIDAIRGLWINDALPMPLSVKMKDEWIAWLEKQAKLVNEYEDRLDRCACESFNKGYKAAIEHQKAAVKQQKEK